MVVGRDPSQSPLEPAVDLLLSLQAAHDNASDITFCNDFTFAMRDIADRFNLNTGAIDQYETA
jgi:hypothetical protein